MAEQSDPTELTEAEPNAVQASFTHEQLAWLQTQFQGASTAILVATQTSSTMPAGTGECTGSLANGRLAHLTQLWRRTVSECKTSPCRMSPWTFCTSAKCPPLVQNVPPKFIKDRDVLVNMTCAVVIACLAHTLLSCEIAANLSVDGRYNGSRGRRLYDNILCRVMTNQLILVLLCVDLYTGYVI